MDGVTTVISLSIGQVLDYEVYSKYCHACSSKQSAVSAGKMTQAACTARQEDRDCSKTMTGSSGSMEGQGAVDLWSRSSERRRLRSVTFIRDEHSKGHQAVVEAMPYGADCPV